MIYTAWGAGGKASALIPGDGPPPIWFPEVDEGPPERIWTIEARGWNDACRQYHELQGWKPYRPVLDPNTRLPYPEDEVSDDTHTHPPAEGG